MNRKDMTDKVSRYTTRDCV